ncbi:MAG: hypothetical protein V4485_03455 [Pseudomonadota bacterium]
MPKGLVVVGESSATDISEPVIPADLPFLIHDIDTTSAYADYHEQPSLKPLKEIVSEIVAKYMVANQYLLCWNVKEEESVVMEVFRPVVLDRFNLGAITHLSLNENDAMQFIVYFVLGNPIDYETSAQCVKYAMQRGVDLNQTYKNWFNEEQSDVVTPLSQAASRNDMQLINFLLANGAVITPSVLRAISRSVMLGNTTQKQIIEDFIARGVDINMCDDRGGILHNMFWATRDVEDFGSFLLY